MLGKNGGYRLIVIHPEQILRAIENSVTQFVHKNKSELQNDRLVQYTNIIQYANIIQSTQLAQQPV